MTRLLLGAALAAALLAPATVDANTLHQHRRHVSQSHHGHLLRSAPVGLYGGRAAYGPGYRGYGASYGGYGGGWGGYRMNGPAWSGPNQCWEDLGYGRYESCDRD